MGHPVILTKRILGHEVMKFHFPDSVVFFKNDEKLKCSFRYEKFINRSCNQNRIKKHRYFLKSNTNEKLDWKIFTNESYFIMAMAMEYVVIFTMKEVIKYLLTHD